MLALVAEPELRALSDAEVSALAADQGRRLVTENVKDFRPLAADGNGAGLLFTSSRRFPRHRAQVGPLIEALDRWLNAAASAPRPPEDWLSDPAPQVKETPQ